MKARYWEICAGSMGFWEGRGQKAEVRRQKAEGRRQKAEEGGAALQAIDVLDDEGTVTVFRGAWIDSPPVRGTGCMLSAAITACLGLGMDLQTSVSAAKRFVADAIRCAPSLGPEPVTLELTETIEPEE